MLRILLTSASIYVFCIFVCSTTCALDIVGTFVPNGQAFSILPGSAPAVAGPPNPNVVGGGSIIDIFETAASYWEAAILDQHTIQIEYGWAVIPLQPQPVSEAFFSGGLNPVQSARIHLSNQVGSFFADPTPNQNEEWNNFTEFQADLGGDPVNTGRVFTSPTAGSGASGRTDLVSVLMHEIGHALGVHPFNIPPSWWNITSPLPHAGTVIPRLGDDAHFSPGVPNALMVGTFANGQRRLPSAIDILAPAQHSGWTNVNLNPVNNPPDPPPGDFDGNGVVDTGDYNKWKSDFGMSGGSLPADGNGNGAVDTADYIVWLNHFGATGSSSGTAFVPEPWTIHFVGVLFLYIALGRNWFAQTMNSAKYRR